MPTNPIATPVRKVYVDHGAGWWDVRDANDSLLIPILKTEPQADYLCLALNRSELFDAAVAALRSVVKWDVLGHDEEKCVCEYCTDRNRARVVLDRIDAEGKRD